MKPEDFRNGLAIMDKDGHNWRLKYMCVPYPLNMHVVDTSYARRPADMQMHIAATRFGLLFVVSLTGPCVHSWDYFLPVYNCPLKEKIG